MTDTYIVILILICIVLFLYIVYNIISFINADLYKKKYTELERGVYKYEPTSPTSVFNNYFYFYLYDYNINTLTFNKTNANIIFFPDGDIKLTENLYIHKNQLWLSLISWHYYRKFHKLKNHLVSIHDFEIMRNRVLDKHRERYHKLQNPDFKFLRG